MLKRVNTIIEEKRLTIPVFLDGAKAFHALWVKDLIYKLTVLNVPCYCHSYISQVIAACQLSGDLAQQTESCL
jgi:hypothetical protein